MDVPQRQIVNDFDFDMASGLDADDTRWRAMMIDDTVSPAESLRGDDFLVVDAFTLVARIHAMGGVPLAGDGAEAQVVRHNVTFSYRLARASGVA
jgi:hypothetical protein